MKRTRGFAIAALVGGLWLAPLSFLGQASGDQARKDAAPPTTQSAGTTAAAPQARSKVKARTKRASLKGGRRMSHRKRRAQLHLEADRINEIQRALSRSGYLGGEPTGKWDEQTRSAMRRYQAKHGFPVTGLPEAKTLMKLGLGPHPLPADVDPSATMRASTASDEKKAPARDQTGQPDSPQSDSPPRN